MMKKLLILMLMGLFGVVNESWAAAQPDDGPQKCGNTLEDCSFIVDSNNNIIISGTGAITGNSEGNVEKLVMGSYRPVSLAYTMGRHSSVIIEEGITNIDGLEYVGKGTTNILGYGAVDVYVPASVTQIGADAFQNSAIGNLVIAGEDTVIDSQALANIVGYFTPLDENGLPIYNEPGNVSSGLAQEDYTTTISCVKGSKTEERLKALIGDNPRFSIGYTESQAKAKRTFYTPAEAAQHVNHTNNNKIIFTFK